MRVPLRYGEAEQQRQRGQKNRVGDHSAERGRRKEPLKPLQSDPFASEEALRGLVVSERDLNAVHRDVLIDDRNDNRNQKHQIQLPVFRNAATERLSVLYRFDLLPLSFCDCAHGGTSLFILRME